jgi:hypothetical protein
MDNVTDLSKPRIIAMFLNSEKNLWYYVVYYQWLGSCVLVNNLNDKTTLGEFSPHLYNALCLYKCELYPGLDLLDTVEQLNLLDAEFDLKENSFDVFDAVRVYTAYTQLLKYMSQCKQSTKLINKESQ